MSDNISNNKRIAKNTILLYMRMLLLMGVNLFTARVVLHALGVEDYGINSVIAGFLSMFGILTGSMSNAISRFITVELGRGDLKRLIDVFSTSLTVQLVMATLIVILIETFGVWFVNTKMNIPFGKESAALWCLHCSAITTFITLMNIPFNSAIIAHEKMSAFAYMSIIDALLKLIICYAIYVSPYDKLYSYASLGVIASCISTTLYWIYSRRNFDECTLQLTLNRKLFKEIWNFAGWNFFGQTAWILNTQGVNMLMNLSFGVVLNAARGFANQINGVLQQFVSNFMTAINPQIMKSYVTGDKNYAFILTCRGARFSFYIMFIIALPVMIEAKQILDMWLGTPPEQTACFMIWTVLSSFSTILGSTLFTLMMAHGNIKKYQLWITIFGCLPFPLTWLAFKLGAPALYAYYIYFIVYFLLLFVRYYLVYEMTGLPAKMYIMGVILRCHLIGILASILPIIIFYIMPVSIFRLLLICCISILFSCITIYLFGLDSREKDVVKNKIINPIINRFVNVI